LECHKTLVKQIIEKQADFILPVKDYQQELLEDSKDSAGLL